MEGVREMDEVTVRDSNKKIHFEMILDVGIGEKRLSYVGYVQ